MSGRTVALGGVVREIGVSERARALAARAYAIRTAYDAEDECFVARAEEFPYLAGAENTPDAAEATLREAIAIAIEGNLRRDIPIPEPQRATA